MLRSAYDFYELIVWEILPKTLPPVVSIRMPEIPPSVPNSAEYLFSQLEELVKRTRLEEGSTKQYRLRLDPESYRQFYSNKPAEMGEEKWLRDLSHQFDKRIRQYQLSTGSIFTEEKIRTDSEDRKYQIIEVTLFRPARLSRDYSSEE